MEEWDGGSRGRGDIYISIYLYLSAIYLWLIHIVVQQKPTQHYKTSILRLKINFKNLR